MKLFTVLMNFYIKLIIYKAYFFMYYLNPVYFYSQSCEKRQ